MTTLESVLTKQAKKLDFNKGNEDPCSGVQWLRWQNEYLKNC